MKISTKIILLLVGYTVLVIKSMKWLMRIMFPEGKNK